MDQWTFDNSIMEPVPLQLDPALLGKVVNNFSQLSPDPLKDTFSQLSLEPLEEPCKDYVAQIAVENLCRIIRVQVAEALRQTKFCHFCKGYGHVIRENGEIKCPQLRRTVCRRCGATGENAHTPSYCLM